MDILTVVVGGILLLLVSGFMFRLFFAIMINLVNGRKFHHTLEQQFSKLRLNKMLAALGINKTDYIYQTSVRDIKQQMVNCSDCESTDECDDKLSAAILNVTDIDFCNNEAELVDIKMQQLEEQAAKEETS